jgi:hypothetical protein
MFQNVKKFNVHISNGMSLNHINNNNHIYDSLQTYQ